MSHPNGYPGVPAFNPQPEASETAVADAPISPWAMGPPGTLIPRPAVEAETVQGGTRRFIPRPPQTTPPPQTIGQTAPNPDTEPSPLAPPDVPQEAPERRAVEQHPAAADAEPPPIPPPSAEVAEQGDAAVERLQGPSTRLVQITGIEPVVDPNTTEPTNRPPEGEFRTAAQAGTAVDFVVECDANGRVSIYTTPGVQPPRASVDDIDPARNPAREEPANDPDSTPTNERWATLQRQRATPERPEQASQQPPAIGALRLNRFVEAAKTLGTACKVWVRTTGLTTEQIEDITANTQVAERNASGSNLPEDVQKAAKCKAALEILGGDGALRVDVAVAAPEEFLEEVATVAQKALFAPDKATYEPIREDGALSSFNTAEEALNAAPRYAADAVVSPKEAGDHMTLPTQKDGEVVGLPFQPEKTNFAVNQVLPPGTGYIEVGQILDNNGQPTGEKLKLARGHTLLEGGSGGGKTTLIHEMAVQSALDDKARGEHVTQVFFDFGKRDNNTHTLSSRLSGAGLTGDDARVHHVIPGGQDVFANTGIFRPVEGESYAIRMGKAIQQLANGVPEEGGGRSVFIKYGTQAMNMVAEWVGIDPKTGLSNFDNPDFPPIDIKMVEKAAEMVMKDIYSGEHGQNLEAFVVTSIQKQMNGIAGMLITGGYDIDPQQLLQHKNISIDLEGIADPYAQQLAASTLTKMIIDACKARNEAAGIHGDISGLHTRIYLDEATSIFGRDSMGVDNAALFRTARGTGAEFVLGVQGNIEGLHPDVLVNTKNTISLGMGHGPDLAYAAGRHLTTMAGIGHLSTVGLGQGLYHARGMSQSVRFASTHPGEVPRGPSDVQDARAILDMSTDSEFFTNRVKAVAESRLLSTRLGLEIRKATYRAMCLDASGMRLDDLPEDVVLAARSAQGTEAKIIKAQICAAARRMVLSCSELQNSASWKEHNLYIRDHMLSQIDESIPKPEFRPDLAIYSARYDKDGEVDEVSTSPFGELKNVLQDALAVPRPPVIDEYVPNFGDFAGKTAAELLEDIQRKENDALDKVWTVVAEHTQPLANVTVAQAELENDQITRIVVDDLRQQMADAQANGRNSLANSINARIKVEEAKLLDDKRLEEYKAVIDARDADPRVVAARQQAVLQLVKLIGIPVMDGNGFSPEAFDQFTDKANGTFGSISKLVTQQLSEDHAKAFVQIVSAVADHLDSVQWGATHNLLNLRSDLEAAIAEKQQTTPAINTDEFRTLVAQTVKAAKLDPSTTLTGDTALAQYNSALEQEKLGLMSSTYGADVAPADIFYPHDLVPDQNNTGGYFLDDVVARAENARGPRGSVHRAQASHRDQQARRQAAQPGQKPVAVGFQAAYQRAVAENAWDLCEKWLDSAAQAVVFQRGPALNPQSGRHISRQLSITITDMVQHEQRARTLQAA